MGLLCSLNTGHARTVDRTGQHSVPRPLEWPETVSATALLCLVVLFSAAWPLQAAPPGAAQPILLVRDSGSRNPYQNFLPELLATEGLNEFQIAELKTLTPSLLAGSDVVVLPHLALSAAQADLFTQYVKSGGLLIAFRPDTKLANLFGVKPLSSSLADAWLRIDTASTIGAGLARESLKFHGAADLYALTTARPDALLYRTTTAGTMSPAFAVNFYGQGKAMFFAFDLTESIVLMRQGNPAWAGYPNDHDGQRVMRPSQMFMDIKTHSFWNGSDDSTLNDIPQADELLHLFSKAILTSANRRPLVRLWYYPQGARSLLIMTGDQHGDPKSNTINEISTIESYGGRFSEFLFYPFKSIDESSIAGWLADGHSFGVHIDDTDERDSEGVDGSRITWHGMENAIRTSLRSFRSTFPDAPPPATTRTHLLLWASNDALGQPDQTAQAKLLHKYGVELDTSFSAYPDRWGYMNGSGLPMKFLDTRTGTVIPVFEQATQYEDDVQLDRKGLYWNLSQAKDHYFKTLSESAERYNSVTVMLFHPDTWRQHQDYGRVALGYAKSHSIPMSSSTHWLNFWKARTSTGLSNLTLSTGNLSFLATGAPHGLTVLVPNSIGNTTVLTVKVDGKNHKFTLGTYQGIQSAALVLPAGTHEISVKYGAVISEAHN
jgi:hypothetical protein